ncbi:unnamed protein product [Effrenium voratum]|nr:unnamed protein product [Effrenium voratum]
MAHVTSILPPMALSLSVPWALAVPDCEAGTCDLEESSLLQLHRVDEYNFGGIVPGDPLYTDLEGAHMPQLPFFGTVPANFYAGSAWPQCKKVVEHIRDQSKCGSCWAVGSISTLNDRLCVMKNDTTTILSADDPLANCNSTIDGSELPTCVRPDLGGCFGGQLEFVWKWYVEIGAVTGAGFLKAEKDAGATCAPYPFPPCHDPAWAKSAACNKAFATPPAFSRCPDKLFPVSYWQNKLKAKTWYKVPSDQIQNEIMAHGSVSCQVSATCSMLNYTGGVYVPLGQVCGGHVMRIVGWGVEVDQDYWWVANSWGAQWGLQGFIKWIRGIDAQGIESGVVAGLL